MQKMCRQDTQNMQTSCRQEIIQAQTKRRQCTDAMCNAGEDNKWTMRGHTHIKRGADAGQNVEQYQQGENSKRTDEERSMPKKSFFYNTMTQRSVIQPQIARS